MAQKELPYRDDGKNRRVITPGKREEYVRAVLEKKYFIKDPLRWIAAQAEADEPDIDSWRSIWLENPLPFKLDEDRGIQLLRDYGERVAPFALRGQDSTTDVLASIVDQAKAELFDSATGYFLVVPQPVELFKFHRGPISNTASCSVYSSESFTRVEYLCLLEDTIFRAWKEGERPTSADARSQVCGPYVKAIKDDAHEADDEYGRATILGTWSWDNHAIRESRDVQRVSRVIIWSDEKGKLSAWLFNGGFFTPDAFIDDPMPQLFPRSDLKVEDILYGKSGLLFKTRILAGILRKLHRSSRYFCLMPCLFDDEILFVNEYRLKHLLPEGGKKLL